MRHLAFVTIATMTVAACAQGPSTDELKTAATERAAQELGVPASSLESTVWVGNGERDGKTVLCGTVSDKTAGSSVPPKRFAATSEPLHWLVFEDAHDPILVSQPNKYAEWGPLCAQGKAA
jgi:hypothetical protein